MRIVSFLPAATEIAFALGIGDSVVGVGAECDYPEEALLRPRVIRRTADLSRLTLAEIDRTVSKMMLEGRRMYELDERLLVDLKPDMIIAQSTCDVCSPSDDIVQEALAMLPEGVQHISVNPGSIGGIMKCIIELGRATGSEERAGVLVKEMQRRLTEIHRLTRKARRARTVYLEWPDPPFCSGHWIPEMVEIAGGYDPLGRKGEDSVRMSIEEVIQCSPEIVVCGACGFDAERNEKELSGLKKRMESRMRGAERMHSIRFSAVDGGSYFARPGPRIVEGVKILAGIMHPELFPQGNSECAHPVASEDSMA